MNKAISTLTLSLLLSVACVAQSTNDNLNLQVVLSAEHDIYMPCLTLDEQEMIVTMRIPIAGTNDSQEDLYMSRRDDQGRWQPLQPITALNTPESEGAPTISADGRWMFFTACDRSDSKGSCDIYFSRRTDNGWTTPANISYPVNSEYWDSQPFFSADGQTLYFVSDRPGGYGEEDIYQATFTGFFNTSGAPVFDNVRNLGDAINTSKSECAPFIHPDGQTLYFSSYDQPGGIGNYDIYYTHLDDAGQWQKPVNIGAPINTPQGDGYLTISASGATAYYASYRQQPDGTTRSEILSFNMPQAARPKAVSYIRGTVYDAQTNKPLEADIELISLADGQRQATVKSNASDGSFLIKLPSGCNYALYSSRDGYLFYSQNFELANTESSAPVVMKVPMSPLVAGEKVALRNVFFDTNSTELRHESYIELDRLIDIMQHNTTLRIEIGGHTDNVGSAEYNKKLSLGRAQSAVNYMLSKGIDPQRITAKGYGLSQPVADNQTEEGRVLNRRIDAKIID